MKKVQYKLPFDWEAFLDERESSSRQRLTKFEKEFLFKYACDWKHCPVGQQSRKIPRYQGNASANPFYARVLDGQPIDATLGTYGAEFSVLIRNRNWKQAKRILICIRERAALLVEHYRKINS